MAQILEQLLSTLTPWSFKLMSFHCHFSLEILKLSQMQSKSAGWFRLFKHYCFLGPINDRILHGTDINY